VAKPGYGINPRAHTLPLSGMYGGHLDFVSISYSSL
jgi:hypothetical protein